MVKFSSILFFSFVFTSLISSCTKDAAVEPVKIKNYDTIFPLTYFPCYPGSYWEYVDSNNDSTKIITNDSYELDSYYENGEQPYSDTFYVPIYNGIPIWGYEAHTGSISYAGTYPLTRILSETLPISSNWLIRYISGTGISRKIVTKDTSLNVKGTYYSNLIMIEEYFSTGPSYYIWLAKRYYAKDVGLIREDEFINDSTINVKEIFHYKINK